MVVKNVLLLFHKFDLFDLFIFDFLKDSFYRDLVNSEEFARALRGDFNFDHPDAFEHTSMLQTLSNLKQYKPAQIPLYDFRTHSRFKIIFILLVNSFVK
jgi:uridine kinase